MTITHRGDGGGASPESRHSPVTIPVVIYAARSKAEEEGKDSTGDQLALIRDRIEHESSRTIVGEHMDHAFGYRGERGPGLGAAMREAIDLAHTHETVELWVWISSRLARGSGLKGEARSVLEVFAHLRRHGVTLRSVEDDQFVTSPMLVGFAAEQAEKCSRDLAANVRRGLDSRAAKGLPHGTPAYGYQRGNDAHWTVEPVEAGTARRIFEEYVAARRLLQRDRPAAERRADPDAVRAPVEPDRGAQARHGSAGARRVPAR